MGVAVRLYDSRDRREIEREFKNEQSRRPISDNIAPKAEEKKASPKKAGKEKQREEKEEIKKRDGDDSIAVLATLSETHRRIFEEMPIDHSVPIDFFTKLGYSMGEIMSTLTILEIKGLIQSMPGGLYAKI